MRRALGPIPGRRSRREVPASPLGRVTRGGNTTLTRPTRTTETAGEGRSLDRVFSIIFSRISYFLHNRMEIFRNYFQAFSVDTAGKFYKMIVDVSSY